MIKGILKNLHIYKLLEQLRINLSFRNLSTKQAFEKIYEEQWWGKDGNKLSGSGSYYENLVQIVPVSIDFLKEKFIIKTIVDIGCGDLNVGKHLFKKCDKYIGIDIVKSVIDSNKEKYQNINSIEFYNLNACNEDLPMGDVYIVREVLQHLNNKEIQFLLQNIDGNFKYLIVVEHYPDNIIQVNMDKPTGPNIRLNRRSAVDILEKPFHMTDKLRTLKEIKESHPDGGYLRCQIFSSNIIED